MCLKCFKTAKRMVCNTISKLRSKKCCFEHGSVIVPNSSFEGENYIGKKTIIRNSSVGFKTNIGHNCQLDYTEVGRYCSIAQNFITIVGNHPTKAFVSTHPFFYRETDSNNELFKEIKFIDSEKKICISIGNDVWIGANVSVLNGVKIGHGAIIGACSLVTKDVPPYSIVAGVPAKVIKYIGE